MKLETFIFKPINDTSSGFRPRLWLFSWLLICTLRKKGRCGGRHKDGRDKTGSHTSVPTIKRRVGQQKPVKSWPSCHLPVPGLIDLNPSFSVYMSDYSGYMAPPLTYPRPARKSRFLFGTQDSAIATSLHFTLPSNPSPIFVLPRTTNTWHRALPTLGTVLKMKVHL